MEKKSFIEKIQIVLSPIGEKLGSQRHLSAISGGIMMAAPITLLSAFINIIANPPVTQDLLSQGGFWSIFQGWFDFATINYDAIMVPYNMTIGLFGLVAVMAISYKLAKSYELEAMSCAIIASVMFLLTATPMYSNEEGISVMNAANLGSSGLFGAMIIALLSTEITRFVIKHGWIITMPESVPPSVAQPFNAIIPSGINLAIWYALSLLSQNYVGCLLPELITTVLTPLFNIVLNPITVCLIVMFGCLMWLFGIHGTSVVYSILMPVLFQNMAANAEAYAAGKALTLYPSALLMWMAIGGTGCTLSLCILMLKSKSAQLSTIAKLALVPNICGVNEPILFGVPIVLNPVLGIPFVCIPAVCGLLSYVLLSLGILDIGHNVLWTMLPIGMQNFLMTGNWVNSVFEFVLIGLQMILWYPFFKAYEKQLLKAESLYSTHQE